MRLTVNVATKLNRSHLVHGAVSYILPVLGRIEVDRQPTGPQALSIEDSLACIHGSKGVPEIAKATLDPNPRVIRRAIAATYPDIFHDYETRMWEPGGFHRHLPARHRVWKTKTGKPNYVVPRALDQDNDMPNDGPGVLRMMTLRSNDQFNTTVYGYSDRFRGIEGTRMIVLLNRIDMANQHIEEGEIVTAVTSSTDGVVRELPGLRATEYDVPLGCAGTYYPEANVLLPVWHYAEASKVPAAKSIPVTIRKG